MNLGAKRLENAPPLSAAEYRRAVWAAEALASEAPVRSALLASADPELKAVLLEAGPWVILAFVASRGAAA